MKISVLLAAAALLFACPHLARTRATQPVPGPTPDDALTAYRAGRMPAFVKAVEGHLRRELAQPKPNEPAVVRLAALRAFASRMAAVRPATAEESEALEWLVRHPTLG